MLPSAIVIGSTGGAGCEENVNSLDKGMGGRLFYVHLAWCCGHNIEIPGARAKRKKEQIPFPFTDLLKRRSSYGR
jgi:hypothetical protein